jgi:lipopolysaccharide/colanic/teichoic acid biosynthesis glycosyltransferase
MNRYSPKRIVQLILGGIHQAAPHGKGIFPTNVEVETKPLYQLFTTLYSALGSAVGLLLLSPLMIGIALAVKLTSPGPAFYRGKRVGRNQIPFFILKFRTMQIGSEAKIGKRLVRQDENHYTSIGRFLRKYRLDELPQLLNVLKRDMNLVGPRPVRPVFLEDHKKNVQGYERRFLVRPGITGQAQVRGGYYTSPRHKLFYEMLYVGRRTVLFDLQLIILTFARVMTRIFTTTLLLCWLLAMVLVAPPEFTATMTISLGSITLNILYLVPLFIVVTHLAQRRMESRRVVAMRTPPDIPIALFLVWTVMIIPFSPMPLDAVRGFGWWLCNGFVVYFLVLNSRMVTDRRGALFGVLVGGTTLIGLTDLIPSVVEWYQSGQMRQIGGPLVNPVLMSFIICLALPLALVRGVRSHSDAQRRAYRIAASILALVGVLTISRAGILIMAVTTAIALWPFARKFMAVIILGLVGVLVGLSLNGDPRMQSDRIVYDLQNNVKRQGKVLKTINADERTSHASVYTGIGARVLGRLSQSRRYRHHKPILQVSNMYLTVMIDHGVIGLLFFLIFLLRALVFVFVALKRVTDVDARYDLQGAAAGVVGCALLFGMSDALYQLPLILAFFVILGLAVGLAAHYGSEQKRVYRIIQYRHNL